MSIKAILTFGDLNGQFLSVFLTVTEGEKSFPSKQGKLPNQTDLNSLTQVYQNWQDAYRQYTQSKRIKKNSAQDSNFSITDVEPFSQDLVTKFNNWLEDKAFKPIRDQLLVIINNQNNEEIKVIIQTANLEIAKLPWCQWELIEKCDTFEVAIAIPNQEILNLPNKANKKVNILAILGDDTGININEDRQFLESLPNAKVEFLVKPDRREISDQLWEQSWDILFFAGHSETENNQGKIWINKTQYLTIEDLKYGLRKAIRSGLLLAIFNSCDGLGLGFDLAELNIPQIIVMREPIPDDVAQQFLKYFLTAYAMEGKSLYLAVREAREKLQSLEHINPCASWLPILFQNITVTAPNWNNLRGINSKKITQSQWNKAYGVTRQEFNNRRSLLNKVNQEVKDRLSQSIHHKILLDLGKEKQPQQVEKIWDVEVKVGNNPAVKIPKETSILDIFEDESIAGKLLILGAPGSGKTTTLLQLAQELIEKADYDINYPIPVIFELSSWKPVKVGLPWDRKEKELTIAEWIERELLSGKYGDLPLDSKVIKRWIKDGEILPLFDGLDELPSERQEKCVQAINQFKCNQMVICSRKEEYEIYETNLRLNGAICLENLDQQQIKEYLERVNLTELWESIKDSSVILELISKPLFLTIMTLGYSQINIEEWKGCNTEERCADYLLGVYVREMFSRKIKSHFYIDSKQPQYQKTKFLLNFLAINFCKQKQYNLFKPQEIGVIQFDWLSKRSHKRLWLKIIDFSGWFGFCNLINLALFYFDYNNHPGQTILVTIFNNLMVMWYLFIGRISCSDDDWSWFGEISNENYLNTLIVELKDFFKPNQLDDFWTKNFVNPDQDMLNLFLGVFFLGFLLGIVLIADLTINFGFLTLIIKIILGLLSGILLGILGVVLLPVFFIALIPLLMLILVPISYIFNLGKYCILRFALYFHGYTPFNYTKFLNYCTERMMLQRVGGRYRFIHRLLQEHFAKMEIEQKK